MVANYFTRWLVWVEFKLTSTCARMPARLVNRGGWRSSTTQLCNLHTLRVTLKCGSLFNKSVCVPYLLCFMCISWTRRPSTKLRDNESAGQRIVLTRLDGANHDVHCMIKCEYNSERQSAGSSELSSGGDQPKAGMGNRNTRWRDKPSECCLLC
jgi:hypothetical protein